MADLGKVYMDGHEVGTIIEFNFTFDNHREYDDIVYGTSGREVELPCDAYGLRGMGWFSEYATLVPHDKLRCPACILLPENRRLIREAVHG